LHLPAGVDQKKWLDQEFNDGLAKQFGISSWDDLLKGRESQNAEQRSLVRSQVQNAVRQV
jgi:hypothetical protein